MEILRALFRGAKVLVLDEPTAVLTAQESQDLFEVLRALKADGTSIVFISHKLNEVLDISDRVTVLRRGEKIDTVATEGATERSLARLMVGRDVLLRVEKAEHKVGEPLLQVEGVSATDDRGLPAVRDVSFEVRAGEIVGIAGVDANGQSELIEVLTGLRKPDGGHRAHRGRGRHRREPARGQGRRASATSRRTAIAAASCSSSAWRRTSTSASTATRDARVSACSRRRRMTDRARGLLKDYDVRGGGAGHARGLAVGRQPAEVSSSRASCPPIRRCSSPRSRRAAWTSARSSSCTAGWWRSATRAARSCSSRSRWRRSARSATACW